MPEWTVNIESPPETAASPEDLERFQQAFDDDGRVLGPACSLNTATGQLGATFQITAPTRGDAALAASLIYWGALGTANLDTNDDSRVLVEPVDGGQSEEFASPRPIRPRTTA